MNNNDVLKEIFSEIKKLSTDVAGIKGEITGIKDEITGIKDEITEMKTKIESMDKRLVNVEISVEETKEIAKLSLEGINLNKEVNEIEHEEIIASVKGETSLVKAAIENLSMDMEFVKQKEYQHEQDMFKLKRKIL